MKTLRFYLLFGFFAACTPIRAKTFAIAVDASLAPNTPSIPDENGNPRPIATSIDASQLQTDFVENEMILIPRDDKEVADFVARYHAVVVGDRDVHVLLRLQTPLAAAKTGVASQDFGETLTVSSDSAAGLVAAVAEEIAAGHKVSTNFMAYGDAMLHSTAEFKNSSGATFDALNLFALNQNALPASKAPNHNGATVAGAWQLLRFLGKDTPQSVGLAVIDGGFYLDLTGNEIVNPGASGSDLPRNPLQWNVSANTPIASGTNESQCSNNSPCPWHGNGSVGVAAGLLNNNAGFAGTGGTVANPILLKSNLSDDNLVKALLKAQTFGAQVINLSFGGECNDFCRAGRSMGDYYSTFQKISAANIVIVASAGNGDKNGNGIDATADKFQPCEGVDGVICVGALNNLTNTRIGYSNFGVSVNIWAPTNISVMDDGTTAVPGTQIHTGTSASAPYVAGVVAMMKAVNPSLNSTDVANLLHETAWGIRVGTDDMASPDSAVAGAGYLDALSAVTSAMGGMPSDSYEPNNTPAQATLLPAATISASLTNNSDTDFYSFTLSQFSNVTLTIDSLPEGIGIVNLVDVSPLDSVNVALNGAESAGATATGFSYSGAALGPGQYQVRIGTAAKGPRPYQITLQTSAAVLAPDAFEVNDTTATAASLPGGEFVATHHTAMDPDYYLFYTGPLGGRLTRTVGIRNANAAQEITLYDSLGAVISSQSATAAELKFGGDDANKFFIVGVTGPVGRYEIYNESGFDLSGLPQVGNLVKQAAVYFIDPSDPWDGILEGADAWLVLEANVDYVRTTNALNLAGEGLQIEMFDENAQKMAGGATQSIDLATLRANQQFLSDTPYLLHITRANASTLGPDGTYQAWSAPAALADGTVPSFASVAYSVTVSR